MMQFEPEFVYPAAAALCALIGSVFDVKSRRIPNSLNATAIVFGLLLHLYLGGWRDMLSAGTAGLICGLVFLVFYLAGGMGAGDVKLMTAVGCLGGMPNVPLLLTLTAIAGGVMGVFVALAQGRLKETLRNVRSLVLHHRNEGLTPHPDINVLNATKLRLPYAVAIAAGCTLTMFVQGAQR